MKKYFPLRKTNISTIHHIGLPIIIMAILIFSTVPFNSCKPEDDDVNDSIVAYKPNIYIYPEVKTALSVQVSFPKGGKILKSIPDYSKWENVIVEKNGLIDNTFEYLFYESKQPDAWQHSEGWIVKRNDLEDFFKQNMHEYGFFGQEIQDFIDYWIPRLTDAELYAIYPQDKSKIDQVIKLSFSNEPDNLLRLFYFIEEIKDVTNSEITEPQGKKVFERNGYFVVEWGVLLK